jgi:hypothetical protein
MADVRVLAVMIAVCSFWVVPVVKVILYACIVLLLCGYTLLRVIDDRPSEPQRPGGHASPCALFTFGMGIGAVTPDHRAIGVTKAKLPTAAAGPIYF